jgi:hypothetical protein
MENGLFMSSISQHNQYQLEQMLDLIGAYESRQVDFGTLVNSLETLFGQLENPPDNWRKAFLKAWGMLEDVHAFALDRPMYQLEDVDLDLIAEAITRLRGLIQPLLPHG